MVSTRPVPLVRGPAREEPPPPFVVPGEHFAAALVWFAAGAVGLLPVAARLAAGDVLSPAVIAVTHCFTLGWVTTSIFGALYQLLPVALGARARCYALAHVTFVVLQAGIVAMVIGSWTWRPPLLAAGWVLLALAALALACNVLPRLRSAPRGGTIARYMGVSIVMLLAAVGLIAVRVAAVFGWITPDRLGILTAHAHLAAIGFATLMAVGVGSKLLPMFLLSHDHSERLLRWIGPLAVAGLLGLTAGAVLPLPAGRTLGGLLLLASVAGYLRLASNYYLTRTRRALDPGLGHVALAHGFLALAALLGGGVLLVPGFRPQLAAAYGIAGLLGWLSLFVVGLYYRILPFLTWMQRFGARVGEPGVPRVADLLMPRVGWATLGLFGGAVSLLCAGTLGGMAAMTWSGAGLFLAGTTLTLAQYLRLGFGR